MNPDSEMSARVRGRAQAFPQLSDSDTAGKITDPSNATTAKEDPLPSPHCHGTRNPLSPLFVPEEGCGASNSRDIQNLTGQGYEQLYQALKSTLLSKVPRNLNYSMVFCVYWRYWYNWRCTCLFLRHGYK